MKLISLLVICVSLSVAAAVAPLLNANVVDRIPDQYLVVFHQNSTVEIRDKHVAELTARIANTNNKIISVFNIGTLIGYAAVLQKDVLATELAHPNVLYIEADQPVVLFDDVVEQADATWGINRVSQRDLPLSGDYSYFESAGDDTTSYIIDTGILLTHDEFEGRATFGANFVTGDPDDDCNGHGTHVAGTVGGVTYGVAKKTALVAVKVLSCAGSGTYAGVISGIQWVTAAHTKSTSKRSVANMSLGGGASTTVDAAVTQSVAAGVNYAIAAGNSAANACNYSPARVPVAVTVGSTDDTDTRSYFSNFGTCVDVFAPGSDITSAWIGSNDATNTISGTSMAAPHVAGAIAVHLGHLAAIFDGVPTPAEVAKWVQSEATSTKVVNPGTGSPNLLLYSPFFD